eukprot:CAMPEP_0172423956 /NCGR_PEP_ID=MMETSP1064-20121228/19674_1 /TAXON_ID=202472 /ORGANISM="Aulacoseira subarctica , Strain CCAP 1002/5" /LENGTH=395 /DNA_ID=CAMNT_0013165595 /DNA_START=269 /DNA_END=1456 /DNA_ORIENTATION=+
MFVALMQLIQKYYHIEKYLKFHKSYANSNDNLMKANLRKFKAGTMVVNRTSTFKEVVKAPKNPIVVILEKSGISITPELLNKISPFSQVQQMYGDKPIVLGLERCQEYRQKVDAADRLVGVAGMFNTGTNLLYDYLNKNCNNPARHAKYGLEGIRWQVPWGKHSPLSYRGRNFADKDPWAKNYTGFLPVVIIKDPYTWMHSLCRNRYAADWEFTMEHCPNLIPNSVDKYYGFVKDEEHEKHLTQHGIPLKFEYRLDTVEYSNMAEAWNTWNGDYLNAEFPRLILRFEDLMLHAKSVITDICHCFGGTLDDETNFHYITGSAKSEQHGHANFTAGLKDALLHYTNSSNRLKAFTKDDVIFANTKLNVTMMKMLSYSLASAENLDNPWSTKSFHRSP